MWSYDAEEYSINWNGNPLFYFYGTPTQLEIGAWDDPVTLSNYSDITGFQLDGIASTAGQDSELLTLLLTLEVLQGAQQEILFIDYPTGLEYDEDSFGILSITVPDSMKIPATLVYFNKLSKVKTLEFVGNQVTLEDFSFVAGIMKNGQRVTPVQFENLSPVELYAITGQFFDLNALEDSDWQRPRTITLNGLRSVYDSGLVIPPFPEQADIQFPENFGVSVNNWPVNEQSDFPKFITQNHGTPLGNIESNDLGDNSPILNIHYSSTGAVTWELPLNYKGISPSDPQVYYAKDVHVLGVDLTPQKLLAVTHFFPTVKVARSYPYTNEDNRSIFGRVGDWYFGYVAKLPRDYFYGFQFQLNLISGNPLLNVLTTSPDEQDSIDYNINVRTSGMCHHNYNQFNFVCKGFDEAKRLLELGISTIGI